MGYADQTVADIATRLPGATAVFRAHRIDYCCGGARPLAEAAAERAVSLEVIESELGRLSADSPPEAPRDSNALIGHILTRYHDTHRRELPELLRLAARVEQRHAGNALVPAGLHAALTEAASALGDHMAKEEQILFPLMMQGHSMIAAPIARMRFEHDEHGMRLDRLEKLAHDFELPEEACPTWAGAVCRAAQADRSTCTSTCTSRTTSCFPASADSWRARAARGSLRLRRRCGARRRVATGRGAGFGWCRPFAVEHVGNRQHRMPPHHAWTGVAHHHAGLLALSRTVAVNLAVRAGGFVRAVRAACQALTGIVEQARAFFAQAAGVTCVRDVVVAAVDAKHHADGLQFARESRGGEPRFAALRARCCCSWRGHATDAAG